MTHRSSNTIRFIAITLIVLLSVYCAILTFTVAFIFIFPAVALLAPLLFIRFKSIELKPNQFIYKDSSILPFLNEEKCYSISNISEVTVIPKATDGSFILSDVLLTTFFRGQTRSQTISLKMKDESFSFISFGNKSRFDEILTELQRQIQP